MRTRTISRSMLPLAALALALTGCSSNSVFDLTVGDCLSSDELASAEITSIEPVDCDAEHDAEVFVDLTLDDGPYPGQADLQGTVQEHCREEFASFVGLPYEESEIYFTTLVPTEQGWEQADDRTALCVLIAPEEVTGSLQGAGY